MDSTSKKGIFATIGSMIAGAFLGHHLAKEPHVPENPVAPQVQRPTPDLRERFAQLAIFEKKIGNPQKDIAEIMNNSETDKTTKQATLKKLHSLLLGTVLDLNRFRSQLQQKSLYDGELKLKLDTLMGRASDGAGKAQKAIVMLNRNR